MLNTMLSTKGFAAPQAKRPLEPFQFQRRDLGPYDVMIEIDYCGVCHSDIHQVRDEWGEGTFPMVPGHEIVGRVTHVGAKVSKFKVQQTVGVGCFVDSCRECGSCHEGLEQYCERGMIGTYNATERDGTPTYGGYSTRIVVNENYVLRVQTEVPLAQVAPLLCAGITTYSPLKHWHAGPGKKVAVMGLGGLGHMGVKLAAAMGAEVTVLSHSDRKRDDAKRLGASHFEISNAESLAKMARSFDLILNTVSAAHDVNAYLNLLKRDGTMVLLGVPENPEAVHPFSLIGGRRSLAGSLIGGIAETQEMLDFCAHHKIGADVEVIQMHQINEAYERMLRADVHYRFVIDLASLKT